jgi:hypothetical protein
LRAFAAGFYAFFHAVQLHAVSRAGVAHFGAQRAKLPMKLAFVHDEIGSRGADRGAIDHQPEMLGRHVLAAFVQGNASSPCRGRFCGNEAPPLRNPVPAG